MGHKLSTLLFASPVSGFVIGLVLTASFSLALMACGGDAPRDKNQWPMSRDELAQGKEPPAASHYRQYCIGCHGVDGRGNGGVTGADFRAATSPLLSKTDAELMASVRDGKRGVTATMPAHKPVLTDDQIAALITYLRATFGPSTSP